MTIHDSGKTCVERALIGTAPNGTPVVLATDGLGISFMVEEFGVYADDFGLADRNDCPTPGLYLWEGVGRMEYETHEATHPTEPVWDGTIRPVRPDELAELYAMTPPLPPELPKDAPR